MIAPGRALPFGASRDGDAVNFAVFSRHAESVELLLFADGEQSAVPWHTVSLASGCHRTGDVWHVRLSGLPADVTFAWRVHGPFRPEQGHRFDADRVLLDPYALALTGTERWNAGAESRRLSQRRGADAEAERELMAKPRCLTAHPAGFDWEGDCPLQRPWAETVIYETHVRGLTADPSALCTRPGTFARLDRKDPALPRARRHRRRADAGAGVLRARRAAPRPRDR